MDTSDYEYVYHYRGYRYFDQNIGMMESVLPLEEETPEYLRWLGEQTFGSREAYLEYLYGEVCEEEYAT